MVSNMDYDRFKAAWASGPGVQLVVHGVEQRQIAQQGTTVNVVLRKDIAAHHHCFRLTSGLRSQNPLDLIHKWLATQ